MKEGKCEEAINCYDEALKLDWTNAVYWCNRYRACAVLLYIERVSEICRTDNLFRTVGILRSMCLNTSL